MTSKAAPKLLRRKLAHAVLGALGLLFATAPAHAASYVVTTLSDAAVPGSLRTALTAINANVDPTADTITFAPGLTGTILLANGELPINHAVTINGPGAGVISISGGTTSRIFNIETPATDPITVGINNLTLTQANGEGGGAIRSYDESLVLDNVVISGSTDSGGGGGGIYFSGYYGATLAITNSTISGNTTSGPGVGGGIWISYASSTITLDNNTFSGNQALIAGGAIALQMLPTATFNLSNSTISGNQAVIGGGLAAQLSAGSTFMLKDSTVSGNTAQFVGGGIDLVSGYGGFVGDAAPTMDTASNGKKRKMGKRPVDKFSSQAVRPKHKRGTTGTVKATADCSCSVVTVNAVIQDSTISGNTAGNFTPGQYAGYGGGISMYDIGGASVLRSAITGNSAAFGGGGAIIAAAGDVNAPILIENSTIANNSSQVSGGGVYMYYGGVAVLKEVTIAGNSAGVSGVGGDGGGLSIDPVSGTSVATLTNSIVANNTAAANPDVGAVGPFNANYTLIRTPDATVIGGGTGNILGQDPLLGLLQNNGGPTASMKPGWTSPVINTGDSAFASPPSIDQRGVTRVAGGRIDMGAVELQPSTLQFTTAAANVNENGGSITLTVSRTGGSDGAISVGYGTADGSAKGTASGLATPDYIPASGTLNWADNDTANKSFNVSIQNDSVFEGNETFSAALSTASAGALLGSPATQTVTILDGQTQPTLSIAGVSQNEGSSGTTPFNFAVTLSGPSTQTVTVHYATANGSATAGSDYTATSGTLTFAPGVTSQTIPVQVIGDTLSEPNETFTVTLSASVNAGIGTAAATGTIQNDDGAITSFTGPTATGSGTATASFTGGGAFCTYTAAALIPVLGGAGSPPPPSPFGYAFPHGLFDFTATSCTPGSTLHFVISYPQALPNNTVYWKYGPTAANTLPHWYQLPATINGNTASFDIVDGGLGDDDLVANGTIVDQGGPGVPVPVPPADVPTLSDWGKLLLAGLLGLLGLAAQRKRRV